MGGCLSTQQQHESVNPPQQMNAQTCARSDEVQPTTAVDEARADVAHVLQAETSTTDAHSAVSSEAPNAVTRPAPEVSMESLGEAGSPLDQGAGSPNPNGVLTESALRQLNQTGSMGKKNHPSSTGGTTANTRPTDLPDVPETGEFADVADLPAASPPPAEDEHAQYDVPDDMPLSTPPPVPEGLPVVSLQDIAVMEQKKGGRGIRVKSRRGSTTASHASLSAIPENVPLHPRSERSDSMRVAHAGQPLNRLADVQELEVESKSNTAPNSRPSHADSPRSSSSVLTSGDDSVMPHQIVEHEYEMHMPILARPRPYWRFPNATEAYRAAHPSPLRSASSTNSRQLSYQHSSAVAPQSIASSDGGAHGDRVLTDDSGLQLMGSIVTVNGEEAMKLTEDDLRLAPADEADLGAQECAEVQQGTLQQESIRFFLPEAIEGLRCVKKYAVGELCWEQVVPMGDFDAGEHTFEFEESEIPRGTLTLGQYRMKTVFMDVHGQYLWAGLHNFQVVKPGHKADA
eukprot:jgi/Ulvmu1/8044/UM004_0281.1